jgi:hypothetical protein
VVVIAQLGWYWLWGWWLWGWCLSVRGRKDEMGVVVVGLVFETGPASIYNPTSVLTTGRYARYEAT